MLWFDTARMRDFPDHPGQLWVRYQIECRKHDDASAGGSMHFGQLPDYIVDLLWNIGSFSDFREEEEV